MRPAFVRIGGAKWLEGRQVSTTCCASPQLARAPDPQARPGSFPPASPCSLRPSLEGKLARVSTADPRVSRTGQLADNTSV